MTLQEDFTSPSAPGDRPQSILILGIGKSGTTALMSAVSQSLGIPFEMEPRNLGRFDYGKSFVAKKLVDSLWDSELKYILNFDKVIFIVRDPRDVLISRLLYRPYGAKKFRKDVPLKGYLDLVNQKVRKPTSVSVRDLVVRLRETSSHQTQSTTMKVYQRLLHVHKYYGRNALLLKYEDFVQGNFTDLDAYLGGNVSGIFEVDPKFGRVARKGGHGDWKNWFTREDCTFFDRLFREIYTTFGYVPESPAAHPVIDRAASSDYIVRIVNDWRRARDFPPYDPRFVHLRDAYERRQDITRSMRKTARRRLRKFSRRVRRRITRLLGA